MTAIQLNAEILRNMSIIAEDEHLLRRVAKYLRKVVAEKKSDPTLMTKEEFFARGRPGGNQEAGRKGKLSNPEEMNAWLNSL